MLPKTYNILVLALDNARISERFELMGGFIYIKDATDLTVNIDVQLDESVNDKLNLKKGFGIVATFKQFFVSHTAQSGKTITLLITYDYQSLRTIENIFSLAQEVVTTSTAPNLYNVTCVNAGTEYSQAFPSGTEKFLIKPRGGNLQVCFTSGGSGTTYILLQDGQAYNEDNLLLTGKTLYFRSATAGCIAEIMAWT